MKKLLTVTHNIFNLRGVIIRHFLLKSTTYEKINFWSNNAKICVLQFQVSNVTKKLKTTKIWWKSACHNFFSVGSKEKKFRQKFFGLTHTSGSRTQLDILFSIYTFQKWLFGIFWPNFWFYIKILLCKVVDLAKIMEFSRTTFVAKTNSLACNFRKCRKNWILSLKSIIKGVPQPKLWVVSKIFCVHFFTLDHTEKS